MSPEVARFLIDQCCSPQPTIRTRAQVYILCLVPIILLTLIKCIASTSYQCQEKDVFQDERGALVRRMAPPSRRGG